MCDEPPMAIDYLTQAIVEFHSLAAAEAGTISSHPRLDQLEMPQDGSTTTVSGKGLSCTVGGLKVSTRASLSMIRPVSLFCLFLCRVLFLFVLTFLVLC